MEQPIVAANKLPRGRPKLHPNQKRSTQLNIRLTSREYNDLLNLSFDTKLSLRQLVCEGLKHVETYYREAK
jgi:hypothetical protein